MAHVYPSRRLEAIVSMTSYELNSNRQYYPLQIHITCLSHQNKQYSWQKYNNAIYEKGLSRKNGLMRVCWLLSPRYRARDKEISSGRSKSARDVCILGTKLNENKRNTLHWLSGQNWMKTSNTLHINQSGTIRRGEATVLYIYVRKCMH